MGVSTLCCASFEPIAARAMPMMVVLLLFGVIIILAQSSAIAPFIYTLF